MKNTYFLFALMVSYSFSLTAQNKESADYIVASTNDTIYGSIREGMYTQWGGHTFVVINADGTKIKYNSDEAKAVQFGGRLYEVQPKNPDKGPDSKKDFLQVSMRNGKYTLYSHATPRQDGFNFYQYFLLEGDLFIEVLSKKNHKQIILDYFGNCKAIVAAFNEKDKWFDDISELSDLYYNNCF